MQLSVYVRVFLCLLRFQAKMNFLWVRLVLNILLKWWVLPMCLRIVKSAIVCGRLCFLCLSLLFQNCLKNEVPHYFFSQKIKRLIISSEKMRRLISSSEKMECDNISSEKNEVPHYFFRKKCWFLSEEIMRNLIFSLKK